MNNIVLFIALLLAFVTGFYCAIKSVNLGLRWQIQTKEGKEPELKTPIESIKQNIDNKKLEEMQRETSEKFQQWMFGKDGRGQ